MESTLNCVGLIVDVSHYCISTKYVYLLNKKGCIRNLRFIKEKEKNPREKISSNYLYNSFTLCFFYELKGALKVIVILRAPRKIVL